MKDVHIEHRPPLSIQDMLRERVRITADHRCVWKACEYLLSFYSKR
jgi:hypothetical protein